MWLIAWPGIYNHDAALHILQLNSAEVPLGNKHSVIYTLLLGGAIKISKLFGDGYGSIAFSCVMLLQAAIMILAQIEAAIFVGK